MTDNEIIEIIKALVLCMDEEERCGECPYEETPERCVKVHGKDLLDLINRQKAEIKRLKGEVAKEFTCFVGNPHKVEHCPYLEELPKVEAEAIKDFAERLKTFFNPDNSYDIRKYIDDLVKEMTGEQQ